MNIKKLMESAIKVYLVGGAVRDSLMKIPCKDLDFVVECESYAVMRDYILKSGGQIFLETPQYLTIRAKVPKLGCADFVLARKDGAYKDGRHPESVEIGTIFDDLSRRDAGMNAIAKDMETGEIVDPFNGRDDIKNKVISAVGNAHERINEDKLRCWRYARFSITKGFTIEDSLKRAILSVKVEDFHAVSVERIREEAFKMFSHDTYKSLDLLREYDNLLAVMKHKNIWLKPTIEVS